MIVYVDASVLLRLVLGESGALDDWEHITRPVSSELIRVECLRVIERIRVSYGLDDATIAQRRAAVLDALSRFDLVPITGAVLERACDPFPTTLGTLDAIHLASALLVRDQYGEMAFATHDVELGYGARSVGFEVHGV